jgi:hypothetical protein
MKNIFLIFLSIIFYSSSFSQIQADHDSFHHDHEGCSHKELFYKQMGNKSVINPNPLVFNYDVKFYKLDIEANDTTNQFSGSATVAAEILVNALDTFSIELSYKLAVDSVLINGVLHDYNRISNNIYIELQTPLTMGELIEFHLFYHTPEGYTSSYYSSTTNPSYGDFHVSQSFSEPYSAHEWMPCKQELEDKADSVHIFVTTDSSLSVAGPGLLTKVNLPEGKIRHEWRTYIPTAYYLIAFAVSDYQDYSIYAKPDSLYGDSVLIQNMVFDYPGCLESNKANIDNTVNMVELLSNLYSIYPFHEEKYGHYLWYPSGFSGMEHITMSGMRYFNTYLISHELGHSWFGDNVTCATWSDIWINEGFATYTQYLVLEYLYSKTAADNQMTSYMNYVMSVPDGSVFVPEGDLNSVGRVFSTRLSYRKGGALVHMIRFEMNNDSLFFKTLQDFQIEYQDSLATGLDFKAVCEEVSGLDFTSFFNQWYFGEGFPSYNIVWSQQEDTLMLNALQSTSTTITPLFKMPMEYKISYVGGDTTIRVYQLVNDTTYSIILPFEITGIEVDPNKWVMDAPGTIIHEKYLDVSAMLEGPFDFNSELMSTHLNPDFIPLAQPYNQEPWNYSGTESVITIPANVVDWVLLEIHDTINASLVGQESLRERKAAFLLQDGSITDMDGVSHCNFTREINNEFFLLVRHRNHLDILSNLLLPYYKGTYFYDFSSGSDQAYGTTEAVKELSPGRWGMITGDANADGICDENDLLDSWDIISGENGYFSSDFNLDGQVDNVDKDDFWLPNEGKGTQLSE